MNWLFAIVATIFAYTLFSWFGLRTAAATSLRGAVLAVVSNPLDFLLIIVGSAGFAVATFFAIKSSPFAVTVVISLGLAVSFVFSVIFANAEVTVARVAGLGAIAFGVWLMR